MPYFIKLNEKYIFFQWILQISGCNKWCKKGAYRHIWRAKRHIFHDFAFVPLSKSCFPPRAGSIFSENRMIFCKKTCSKHGRHKENSRSYTKLTKLLQRCIHSFLLTGLWGRKMHGTAARSNILMRAWSEKMAIETGKKAKRANSMTKKCSYRDRLGAKKVKFLIKITWSRFAKMCPPLEQEQYFWKNVMQKMSWNMKSIQEAVWSLHFWCKFVIKSTEDSFLLLPARHWLLFLQNHKISLMVGFGWPGGMRRCAGGRYEGGLWSAHSDWHSDFCALSLTRRAMPTARAADRSAHSARPSHRQWELRHGKQEMGNENL